MQRPGDLGGLTGGQAAAGVRAKTRAKLAVIRDSSGSASFALVFAWTPAASGGQVARPVGEPSFDDGWKERTEPFVVAHRNTEAA